MGINNMFTILWVRSSIIWIIPFIGIVLESLRVESKGQESYFWPKQFGFDNYIFLFEEKGREYRAARKCDKRQKRRRAEAYVRSRDIS